MGQPKGLDWEGRVAKALRDVGLAGAERLGTGRHGDVRCAPMLIECKNEKAPPSLRGAFKQALGDLRHYPECSVPIAVCKTIGDRKGTLLVMRFDDWLEWKRTASELTRQVALLQTERDSLRHELERAVDRAVASPDPHGGMAQAGQPYGFDKSRDL
jgi:hypothetical protein